MNVAARNLSIVAVVAVAFAACDGGDDATGPEDGANFEVVLKAESQGSPVARRAAAVVGDPLLARLSLTEVASIRLPIGLVEAHQQGGGWIEAGFVGEEIDLLDLPSEGVELVETSLPEGTYTGLRLFLDGGPTVTLEEELEVGRTVYEAGEHPLVIPSVGESGLKLNATFAVDADGQLLTVLFDGDASVRRVTATGAGTLMIAPVLRVMNEDDEEVGGVEDGDEDDEGDVEFEGFVEAVGAGSVTLTDGTVVRIDAETRIAGDLFTLAAVAEAVAAGEVVEVEGEGEAGADGSVLASEIEFELEDDDRDDEEEVELEGVVTGVDRSATAFTLTHDGGSVTVLLDAQTVVGGDFDSFEAMADAFEDGQSVEAEAEGELTAGGELLAFEVDFEAEAEEFEGDVIAVTRGSVESFTVLLGSGATLVVAVTSATDFHPAGDFTSFEAMADAVDTGASVRAEGRGTLDASGILTAAVVKFETD